MDTQSAELLKHRLFQLQDFRNSRLSDDDSDQEHLDVEESDQIDDHATTSDRRKEETTPSKCPADEQDHDDPSRPERSSSRTLRKRKLSRHRDATSVDDVQNDDVDDDDDERIRGQSKRPDEDVHNEGSDVHGRSLDLPLVPRVQRCFME